MKNNRRRDAMYLIALLAASGPAWGQVSKSLDIAVVDPRPLKKAIDVAEVGFRIPINYEDPRFEWAGDTEDVTDKVQNSMQRAAHPTVRIVIPKGGSLAVSVVVPAAPTINDIIPVVTLLVGQYKNKNYPGRFTIQQVGGIATVEPVSVQGKDGIWRARPAVMDTRLSFPDEERNAAAALAFIAKALTERNGVRVGVGRFPVNAFANVTVRLGARDESASTVLVRLFDRVSSFYSTTMSSSAMYSYRLLYDPGAKRYFLHVNAIQPRDEPVSSELELQSPPPKGFLMQLPPDK